MIFLDIHAQLPTTLWGWVAVAGGIAGFLSLTLGLVIRTGRGHIDRKIQIDMKDMKAEIKETVDDAIRPLSEKIDHFGEGRIMFGERIANLESTINNGLTHATEKTARDVDEIKIQVAQIHGWMKATHGPEWNTAETENG